MKPYDKSHELIYHEPGTIYVYRKLNSGLIERESPPIRAWMLMPSSHERELKEKAFELFQKYLPYRGAKTENIEKYFSVTDYCVAQVLDESDIENEGYLKEHYDKPIVGAAAAIDWGDMGKERGNVEVSTIVVEESERMQNISYCVVRLMLERLMRTHKHDKIFMSRIYDKTGAIEKILKRVRQDLNIPFKSVSQN